MSEAYFGLSADEWQLVFGALQTLIIVVGIPLGVYELIALRRDRTMASLEKMLDEWREGSELRGEVLGSFPLGGSGSVPDRALGILGWVHDAVAKPGAKKTVDLRRLFENARAVVNRLNDLGSYVELRLIEDRYIFSHLHYAILRLTHLLEPYVLLRTALRDGNRWGMRLRRLRKAAEGYHRSRSLHRYVAVKLRGETILAPSPPRLRDRLLRRRLMPSTRRQRREDERDILATQAGIRRAEEQWSLSTSQMDEWFGPI